MKYSIAHKEAARTCNCKGVATETKCTNFSMMVHEGKDFASLAEFFAQAAFQSFQKLKLNTRLILDSMVAVRHKLTNEGVTV